jgi:hypothetical protein
VFETNIINIRNQWLRNFAEIVNNERPLIESVAEAGVFRGEFAKLINECFPNRKLYLFDTFEGFSKRDLKYEAHNSIAAENRFDATNEQLVIKKMKHPNTVVIKNGYFPETALDVREEFLFVSLDMDLYKPMLEGLKFFYDAMIYGGVILCHDYYSTEYPGTKQAVEDYEKLIGMKLLKLPIGDQYSIAIVKTRSGVCL